MLSAVERGERSPTINVLCNIASGLGCTVGSLVDEIEPAMSVQTRAQRAVMRDPETGACRSLLAPSLVGRGVELVHYTIPSGRTIGPFPPAHSGVPEHITVFSGELSVDVDERIHHLGVGDSITYVVTDALRLSAAEHSEVEFLLVLLPNHGRLGPMPTHPRDGLNRKEPL